MKGRGGGLCARMSPTGNSLLSPGNFRGGVERMGLRREFSRGLLASGCRVVARTELPLQPPQQGITAGLSAVRCCEERLLRRCCRPFWGPANSARGKATFAKPHKPPFLLTIIARQVLFGRRRKAKGCKVVTSPLD